MWQLYGCWKASGTCRSFVRYHIVCWIPADAIEQSCGTALRVCTIQLFTYLRVSTSKLVTSPSTMTISRKLPGPCWPHAYNYASHVVTFTETTRAHARHGLRLCQSSEYICYRLGKLQSRVRGFVDQQNIPASRHPPLIETMVVDVALLCSTRLRNHHV